MNAKTAIKQFKALQKIPLKPMRLAAESWETPFQTLISIILSARTRDETTIKIATNLFSKYPAAEKLSNAPISKIQAIIKSVNFYKNKSKSISNCAKILADKYHGTPPKTINELLTLPGVGRKTANVFLQEQYNHATIGVDTHVEYISRYLNWTASYKANKIEKDLENLFPKSMWSKLNPLLVRFGKTYISRKKQNVLLDKIKQIR